MTLVSDADFGVYSPAAIGWGGDNDPELHPGLLALFTHSGVSFGWMHRDVHGLFTALLDQLVPHIEGGLVAGTCGCYNPGSVTVGGTRSFHTYGIAIDVNWAANPMYAPAHPTGPHTLPDATSGIARAFGCEWGGDWTYPADWMHIETHLPPNVARTVQPGHTPAADTTTPLTPRRARMYSLYRDGQTHHWYAGAPGYWETLASKPDVLTCMVDPQCSNGRTVYDATQGRLSGRARQQALNSFTFRTATLARMKARLLAIGGVK